MIDRDRALAASRDWIAAWNAHDLAAVLMHYADDLVFVSPLVVKRLGRADGTIRDKAELVRYFAESLGHDSQLHFELEDVLVGVDSWTMLYANHRGQRVAETVFPDADGRIRRAHIHHL